MRWLDPLLAVLALEAGCSELTLAASGSQACQDNADCVESGTTCVAATGQCAASDTACSSGLRYAGAGTCVPIAVAGELSFPESGYPGLPSGLPVTTWGRFEASGTESSLSSVWGSSPADVYAVGASGVILHRSATGTWMHEPSHTALPLRAVTGTGPADVYVGGPGFILHRKNDGEWRAEPCLLDVRGLWASGPGDVYAVGVSLDPTEIPILHSTGNGRWSAVAIPSACDDDCSHPYFPLNTIAGSSPRDIYAAGDRRQLLHFDGRAWSLSLYVDAHGSTLYPESGYSAVWVGQRGAWLSSQDWNAATHGALLSIAEFSQHDRWTVKLPFAGYRALWGNSTAEADSLWAVGSGLLLHSTDGETFHVVAGRLPLLASLWGSSSDNLFAVGDGGIILHGP
jgi:hypothetical protein